MASDAIPAGLLAQLKARAADPKQRSDTTSIGATAVSLESLLGSLAPNPDPGMQANADRVQSMLGKLTAVFGGGGASFAMIGPGGGSAGGFASLGGDARAPAPAGPCSADELAEAEAAIGPLPQGLRQLYLEIGDGGFGPGAGLYSRSQLVAKYREMIGEPVGLDGEAWPANVLPLSGADWDLIAIDRESGALVYFDAEELAEGEPDDWSRAFKPEAESLAAWLAKWLGAPTPAEERAQWEQGLRRGSA